MGLMDFIKGQFIEIIEWVDDSRDTIVWKFPDTDREIKMGAQLTVRDSQVAIFINEGKVADVYGPGRHELVTRNMPIMSDLKGWKYGFNSPFRADVYFVSTRQFANMRWGTKQPIMVSDPEFSMVQLRAFGTFSFQVSDAKVFFAQFAGTDSRVTTDELLEHFRSQVVTEFSNALKKSGKTIAEINFRSGELGAELLPILQPQFDSIGLKLLTFNVESVSLPDEIMAELNKQDLEYRQKKRTMTLEQELELQKLMAKANISQNIGDMQKFMQMQAAVGMENPGSGGGDMSDMAKAMMQMNMMQQMMQNSGMMNPGTATQAPKSNGGEAMSKDQIMALLKELGELKTAGILTEEEFNTKKAELLAKL